MINLTKNRIIQNSLFEDKKSSKKNSINVVDRYNKKRLIKLILTIIFISLGIFDFILQKNNLAYKGTVDNIILNTLSSDQGEVSFVTISIEIKSKSPNIELFVEKNKAEIMDKAINLIYLRSTEELIIPRGKELLKTDLIDEIKNISNGIDISDLIFTEYIIVR